MQGNAGNVSRARPSQKNHRSGNIGGLAEALQRHVLDQFGALLFVQVIQAVLVVVLVQLLRHLDWLGGSGSELMSGLVLVTVLYVLLQLPLVAVRWAFQQPASWTAPLRTTVVAARRAMAA